MALLTWLPVVSGFPWRALHGMTAVAFGMAMYVGVFAAAATPTMMTGSYRVNERSITLGVALGVFLVYRSLGTLG